MDEQSRTGLPRDGRKQSKPARPADATFTAPAVPTPSTSPTERAAPPTRKTIPPAVVFQPPLAAAETTAVDADSTSAPTTGSASKTPAGGRKRHDAEALARPAEVPAASVPDAADAVPTPRDSTPVESQALAKKVAKKATKKAITAKTAPSVAGAEFGDPEAGAAGDTTSAPTTAAKPTKRTPRKATQRETVRPAAAAESSLPTDTAATEPRPRPGVQPTAAQPLPMVAAPEPAPRDVAQQFAVRLLAQPDSAPELLALAAVELLGPGAQSWARRLTYAYPAATPDGLARLATQRFVRLATAGGAVCGTAGVLAPLVGLAAVAWSQAGLVLHLAAAYGQDPTHPERAVDLLVLTRMHPDEQSARAALTMVQEAPPEFDQPLPRLGPIGRRLRPLTAETGGWLSLRLASRWLPGAALLTAAAGNSIRAERLAARTVAHYRGVRAS